MDRAFERAFTKVHTGVNAAIPDPEAKAAAKLQSEEERLRQETAPITAKDAVARITLAFRDGDYFRCMPHAALHAVLHAVCADSTAAICTGTPGWDGGATPPARDNSALASAALHLLLSPRHAARPRPAASGARPPAAAVSERPHALPRSRATPPPPGCCSCRGRPPTSWGGRCGAAQTLMCRKLTAGCQSSSIQTR